jgi:glutamate dehydrogenase (NAD(P)+)
MDKGHKEALIRAFAKALRNEEDYIFGPDMGTNEECMAWVRDEIGRAVGLPEELGGIPLDRIGATGWGLLHATQVALDQLGLGLRGCRIVVQGFGSVGLNAARYLTEAGAILVGAADSQGAIYDPAGLEVAALIQLKRAGGKLTDHPAPSTCHARRSSVCPARSGSRPRVRTW